MDPDRCDHDEAEDLGELQPRQFLGTDGDGGAGSMEPVANVAPTPSVPGPGPPALPADAVGCTAKAWQEKDVPAFKDKDTLTPEFTEFFNVFPKAKDMRTP